MFKSELYGKVINNVSNRIFEKISKFFSGSSATPLILHETGKNENYETNASSAIEWELHQGVSDILINDVKASLGWIFPSSFYKMTDKLKKDILFFFYSDMIDENTSTEEPVEGYSDLTIRIKTKVIYWSGRATGVIQNNLVSFREACNDLLLRIMIYFKPIEEPDTFYLLGNFAPDNAREFFGNYKPASRKEYSNFISNFTFHKRN